MGVGGEFSCRSHSLTEPHLIDISSAISGWPKLRDTRALALERIAGGCRNEDGRPAKLFTLLLGSPEMGQIVSDGILMSC